MENNTNTRVVTLSDIWDIFVHHIWIMILAAIVAAGSAYAIVKVTYTERYESVATLYILQQNTMQPQMQNNNYDDDFNLALKVVNDCTHLLKSHSVLETVIRDLNLDITYEDLYDEITVSNPEDTRILEVRAESNSPESAKRIVDHVCTEGTEKITEAMGFKQVNFYERGILDNKPCNRTSLITYILVAFIAAALVYAYFFIYFLLDDRIQTDEDIAYYLNVSVLGDIPNAEEKGKKKYGYKYYRRHRYGSKYKYYGYGQEGKENKQ